MRDYYDRLSDLPENHFIRSSQEKRVTISAKEMNLNAFLRALCLQAKISVIAQQDLDSAKVTMEVSSVPVDQVLSVLARRLSVELSRQGDFYYMGKLRPEDLGLLVCRVGYLTDAELKTAIETVAGKEGRNITIKGGVVVLVDRVEVIQNVQAMIEQVACVDVPTWVIQVYIIETDKSYMREIGLDSTQTAKLSYTLGKGIQSGLTGEVEGIFKSSMSRSKGKILLSPMMLVSDGQEVVLHSGDEIPFRVQESVTGDNGDKTYTTGYETIPVGTSIKVTARDSDRERVRLSIEIDVTQVSGIIDDLPQTLARSLKTDLVCAVGGVYLVGEMQDKRKESGGKGILLPLLRNRNNSESTWQIWVRSYRISGEYNEQK